MHLNKNNLNNWALPEEGLEWMMKNIPQGSVVVELGSGTGTIELCKLYTVFSVEQDEKWMNKVKGSTYIYAPLKHYPNDAPNTNGWYDDSLFEKLPEHYDFLIVDGPIGADRGNFINFCHMFKKDIPFFLDDTNRTIDRNLAYAVAEKLGKKLTEIKGHQKNFIILI